MNCASLTSWRPRSNSANSSDGRVAFDADWTRQRAAERLLEIIGEAANALSEEHHYHRVDMDQLWTIATVNIPEILALQGKSKTAYFLQTGT